MFRSSNAGGADKEMTILGTLVHEVSTEFMEQNQM
jgi:hypothetical protein